ncbi:MAG TPA: hypothetical protein VFP60_04205 [Pseudolabrys sp.]|nr:hypothetical protein [Pseudolabrys sp.]
MRRAHIEPLPGSRVDPSTGDAPAWKYERVLAVLVDHSEFQVAVVRCR